MRLSARVVTGVGLTTAVTIGGMAALIVGAHRVDLVEQVRHGAGQLSDTIRSSTHSDMMENRREALQRQIEGIGKQDGIRQVRVFNRKGQIGFSSNTGEIGRILDPSSESCTACHRGGGTLLHPSPPDRTRILQGRDERLLSVITPIPNEPGCSQSACHAHEPSDTLLGVLEVSVSLADVDQRLASGRMRLVLLALAAIGAGSLALWWLTRTLVLQPVRSLAAATHRIAEGELGVTVPAPSSHELGDLARSFNTMTTRLSETQRQLAQADKLASVGRLAAGIAHEINNPLTGVLTYSSLLANRTTGEQDRSDLDVIVRETKRCREIVRNLLDFARPAAPKRASTDLNEVVRRSVAVVMNQLAIERVQLTLDLAESLPTVSADANQIQQVLVNLLINASDAIGEGGGTIRMSSRPVEGNPAEKAAPPPGVEIAVEDDGAGISADQLSRVFEPFFTTKGSRGTGLGLAVTWGIVEAHGGSILVDSIVGRGSRFTVRLPLVPAAGTVPRQRIPEAAAV